MSIYEQLARIAERNPHLLVAYKADLHEHDKRTLAKAERGTEFIWILRDHGTELFEMHRGSNPVWVTYWIDQKMHGNIGPQKRLCYHIFVTADGGVEGTVRPITVERARLLAHEPPAKPKDFNPIVINLGGGRPNLTGTIPCPRARTAAVE